MKSTKTKTIDAQDLGEQEEQVLLAAITACLDGEDEQRYQAVDEFSDEFLVQAPKLPR